MTGRRRKTERFVKSTGTLVDDVLSCLYNLHFGVLLAQDRSVCIAISEISEDSVRSTKLHPQQNMGKSYTEVMQALGYGT